MKTETRSSNIELLRIICILMIITIHFIGYGDMSSAFSTINNGEIWASLIGRLAAVAVDCFAMISGYYMISSKFKSQRILKTWILVFFYSVILYYFMTYMNWADVGWNAQNRAWLPFLSNSNYYATFYIKLCILSPFLNHLLNHLTKKRYQILLVILFVGISIIDNFDTMGGPIDIGSNFATLTFCYCIGAYIRLHVHLKKRVWPWLILYIISAMAATGVVLWFNHVQTATNNAYYTQSAGLIVSNLGRNSNPFTIIGATSLLFAFLNISIKNKLINLLGSSTFGVYLIHDNENVRYWLWGNVSSLLGSSSNPIFFAFTTIIKIFIAFSIVDLIRQLLFKFIHVDQTISSISNLLDRKIQHLLKEEE